MPSNYMIVDGDLVHASSGFSKKSHKYVYKEKLPNGKWRYYYKQPEVKGPRGNARYNGSRYGNYATKDGKHTIEYIKGGKKGGRMTTYGGNSKNPTWSHTVISEDNSDRRKIKMKRKVDKAKKWIRSKFKK